MSAAAPGRDDGLSERVEALAAWIHEVDALVRATAIAGDPETLTELARVLEAWAERDPRLEDRLTSRIEVLADRLATLSATVSVTAAALAGKDGEIAALRRELEQGNARIDVVLTELRSSGSARDVAELRNAVAALSVEHRPVTSDAVEQLPGKVGVLAERLDTLSKTVATTAAGLAGREGELARLRRLVESGDAAGEAARRARLARESEEETGPRPAVLADRLDAIERDREESSEHELVALSDSQAVVARLDQVGERIDSLEKSIVALAMSSSGAVAGDGRFRVELRGLELRMEHAETTARENRETLLMQLERVASRVEWRLEQLEARGGPAPYLPTTTDVPVGRPAGRPAGRVVPIRGDA